MRGDRAARSLDALVFPFTIPIRRRAVFSRQEEMHDASRLEAMDSHDPVRSLSARRRGYGKPGPGICDPHREEGDSLGLIAAHYLPYTDSFTSEELINDIKALNTLRSGMLSIGQTLTIPVVRNEPVRATSRPKTKDFAARGIYVNEQNAGTGRIFDLTRRLRSSGENTVVVDVKEVKGTLAHSSSIPGVFASVSSCSYSIGDIYKLIDHLHKMDMHVVARVCVFRDRLMASSMEGWRYNEEWVDPANEDVQQYHLALIRELIGLGVDEIQLDYFRYPADGRTDTGVEGKDRSDIIAEYLAQIHDLTSTSNVLLSWICSGS